MNIWIYRKRRKCWPNFAKVCPNMFLLVSKTSSKKNNPLVSKNAICCPPSILKIIEKPLFLLGLFNIFQSGGCPKGSANRNAWGSQKARQEAPTGTPAKLSY